MLSANGIPLNSSAEIHGSLLSFDLHPYAMALLQLFSTLAITL
jgi:hypothetical protein